MQLVTRAGQHQHQEEVGHVGDHGLGLAGADGLDQHHVVPAASQISIDFRRVFAATPPSVPEAGEGRTKALELILKTGHARLVREDRPAGPRRRRVDSEDGDLVALAGQERAERVDGGRLAHARYAGDADADGFAGRGQQVLHQAPRRLLMVGAPALDQGDGAGDHGTLAGSDAARQIRKVGSYRAARGHKFAPDAHARVVVRTPLPPAVPHILLFDFKWLSRW